MADLVARKALPPVDLGALTRPHGLTLHDGRIYFTAEGAKVVGRLDPATNHIDWVMGTGQNRTHMVIVSQDGKKVFTTNVASATVCLIEQVQSGFGPGGPPPAAEGLADLHLVGLDLADEDRVRRIGTLPSFPLAAERRASISRGMAHRYGPQTRRTHRFRSSMWLPGR